MNDDLRESAPADEVDPTAGIGNIPRTLWWGEDESTGQPAVFLIDQTKLPLQGDILACSTSEGVCLAVKSLAVRGAPALGVAAALAMALWAVNETRDITDPGAFLDAANRAAAEIALARPTAVNLQWGARRMRQLAQDNIDLPLDDLRELMVQEALNILSEDEARNRQLGAHGAALFSEGTRFLTHCNAGSLATAYFGTALGVIFAAHEQGKVAHVWVDETRPVNQGGRLTAWELMVAGVPSALITDNMAASIMRMGEVDAVIVGADRICANGDTANKIGTYGLAVLAKEHGIPFYVAAPTSTFDLNLSNGDRIPIEQRDVREVTGVPVAGAFTPEGEEERDAFDVLTRNGTYAMPFKNGHELRLRKAGEGFAFDGWFRTAPINVAVYNPAFDVTPAEYITAFITERGVLRAEPDFETALAIGCMGSGAIHEYDPTA